MASAGARLREMMAQGLVVAPGVYDGITAKLVQAAGHKILYKPVKPAALRALVNRSLNRRAAA